MLCGRTLGQVVGWKASYNVVCRQVPVIHSRNISFLNFFKKGEKKDAIPNQQTQPAAEEQPQSFKALKPASMEDRYRACMVLAGVGDALGYNNGKWEFTFSGPQIHEEYEKLGGLAKIDISKMIVSDDQTMHLATAEALLENPATKEDLYKKLSECYVESFRDMMGRSPGPTTESAINRLAGGIPYDCIRYSPQGGGCGGAMRAMCIGLRYPQESQRDDLIAVAIESARMTHNHPTGFFGALISALFTSYAIQGVPVVEWGRKMAYEILLRAYNYVEKQKRDWDNYKEDLVYFENAWARYLKERDILKTDTPKFPENFDHPGARDRFYRDVSFKGWGGASGHDSVIIAYDALLGAGNDFDQLVKRGTSNLSPLFIYIFFIFL
eukprot:Phypoly_transcript_06492.p1 GENE.Phypoly_transcript_06492~~Phypoly_transcript_06492.p1  ORF type:complete len:382 (+),score=58.09 Phypoly_transcript_06492:105-1250(+)